MSEEVHAFIDAQDVKDITAPFFKDGEVVTIKRFSYADRQSLSGEYLKLSADWGGEKGGEAKKSAAVKSEIVLGKMNLSILWKGIKSWVLHDRDGKTVSLSRANLQRLSDPYAEFILEEINALNPSRVEAEDEEEDAFFPSTDSSGEGDW